MRKREMLESPKKFRLIRRERQVFSPFRSLPMLVFLVLLGTTSLSSLLSGQELAARRAPSNPYLSAGRLGQFSSDQAGIRVKARSVLFGSPRHCRAPATIDFKQVLDATPEMQKIQDEDIPKGSAKYIILVAKAVKRIRKVVAKVAVSEKRDCVVKAGSIRENPKDLEVVDLTDKVIEGLENVDIGEEANEI